MQSTLSILSLLLSDTRRLPDLDEETAPKFFSECGARLVGELRHIVMDCPEPHLARLALGHQTLGIQVLPDDLSFDVVFVSDSEYEMDEYRRYVSHTDFLLPDLPKLVVGDDFARAWTFVSEMVAFAGISLRQHGRIQHLIKGPTCEGTLEMLMLNPSVTTELRRRVLENFERDYFATLVEVPEFTYSCMQDLLDEKALERELHEARKLRRRYNKI